MGKRILAQRKGRGTLAWRSPSHRHIGAVKYRPFAEENLFKFKVIELIHSPGRGAPVAKIKYDDGEKGLYERAEDGRHTRHRHVHSQDQPGRHIQSGGLDRPAGRDLSRSGLRGEPMVHHRL